MHRDPLPPYQKSGHRFYVNGKDVYLSKAQFRIFILVATHAITAKEICELHKINRKTFEKHIQRIYAAFNCYCKSQLMVLALRLHIIDVDDILLPSPHVNPHNKSPS